MAVSFERCDSYEDQLHTLFISCDQNGNGELNRDCLQELCQKLELSDQQSKSLITALLRKSQNDHVTFEVFKEGLVSLLEELSSVTSSEKPVTTCDGELEPKVVIKNKRYGRKSRPSSVDISDSEVEEASKKSPRQSRSDRLSPFQLSKSLSPSPVDDGIIRDIDLSAPSGGIHNNLFLLGVNCGEDGEREYLGRIWARLGVGKDGFLDRNELGAVCECVGREKFPKDVVDQLFEKLDSDCDGRVSFEDLLALFQTGRTFSTSPPTFQGGQNTSPASTRLGSAGSRRSTTFSHHSSPLSDSLKQNIEYTYFSAIDPNNTGFASLESVLEYLETLGIQNGSHLLKSLGLFNPQTASLSQNPEKSPQSSLKPQNPVNLKILTNLLNNEIDTRCEFEDCNNPEDFLLKSGIVACRSEVRFLRSNFDNVTFERNKLRLDLGEANQRALLLAQEIDDQNARLERGAQLQLRELEQKYVDQIRELQSNLSEEKEQHLSLTMEMDSKRRLFNTKLTEKEGELREEMSAIANENKRLERENSALATELCQVRSLNATLQAELEALAALKSRLLELEGACADESDGKSPREQISELNERINDLTNLNKDLRDQNDELNLQVEAVKALGRASAPFSSQLATVKKSSESPKKQPNDGQKRKTGLKRRKSAQTGLTQDPKTGSENSYASSTSSDEVESDNHSPREGKLFRPSLNEAGNKRLREVQLRTSADMDPEPQLESLSVELGLSDPVSSAAPPLALGVPPLLLNQDHSPSSLESVDDALVLGNVETEELKGADDPEAEQMKEKIKELEDKCRALEENNKKLEEKLSCAEETKENEELSQLRNSLREANMKFSESLREKERLESNLRQTTLVNVTLTSEVDKVGLEMESVQSRLLSALHEIDQCKEQQTNDEDRITILTSKCSKLEDRLRESVIVLGSPASTLSRSSSSASSSQMTTSTIRSSSSNENIQIIAVRNNNNANTSHGGSSTSSPMVEVKNSSRRPGANSPNVSKVMLNPSMSLGTTVSVDNAPPRKTLGASASFSGALHGLGGHNGNQPSSLPLQLGVSNAVKRSRSASSDNDRSKVQVFQLEQHCKNLEGELDHVKDEIMRIITDKSNKTKENQSLKHYVKAYEDLRLENQNLKKELALIKLSPPKSPSLNSNSSSGSSRTNSEAGGDHQDVKSLDRSSPDGQEFEGDTTSSTSSSPSSSPKSRKILPKDPPSTCGKAPDSLNESEELLEESRKELEKAKSELETLKESSGREKIDLESKISSLEDSLELMRNEFENMEDYWQGKLDSERQFYENQISHSDSSFKELQAKMKEYEELLLASDSSSASNPESEKLSTIAETASLEGQMEELQSEVDDLKEELAKLAKEKDSAEFELNAKWQVRLAEGVDKVEGQKAELEQSLRQMGDKMKRLSEDLEKVTEERDALKHRPRDRLDDLRSSREELQRELRRCNSVNQHNNNDDTFSTKQPSSLPPNLNLSPSTVEIKSDLQRLEELRRVVQLECDELIARRDRLQKEVVCVTGSSNGEESKIAGVKSANACENPNSPSPPPPMLILTSLNSSGSLSLDASFRFDSGSESLQAISSPETYQDPAAPANPAKQFKSSALSSLARAYKTVLADIEMEKSQIAKEFNDFKVEFDTVGRSKGQISSATSFNPIRALQNRLKHQDIRCRQLKDCLNQQQDHSKRILQATREQHKSEIENLETLIKVNQEILQSHMSKYNDQVHKLIQSDALVKELFSQNESLIIAIELLEESIAAQGHSLEGSLGSSSSGISSNSDNLAKDCLNAMCKLLISEEQLEEAVKSQARSETKEESNSLFSRTKRMIS